MRKPVRAAILAFAIIVASLPAMAQSNHGSTQGAAQPDAADQFKSAGQHIGQGAQHLGEGIKQGAIQFWNAVKAGAETVGNKLSGHSSAPDKTPSNSGQ